MSEEPEDLLIKRLMLKDQQVAQYKETIGICENGMRYLISLIEKMAESLPEPEVMRDAANYVDYPLYKEYLLECANLFDYYKTNIVMAKELGK